MPTFKEQQMALVKDQHRLAVWEMLFQYLEDNYISKDGRDVEKGIRVPDCLIELVSEETVEEVLEQLTTGPIETLKKSIEDTENSHVELTVVAPMPPENDHGEE